MAPSPRSYINWILFFMASYCFFSETWASLSSTVTSSNCWLFASSSSSKIPIFTKRFTSSASFASISPWSWDCFRSIASISLLALSRFCSAFAFSSLAFDIFPAKTFWLPVKPRTAASIRAAAFLCTLLFFMPSSFLFRLL